MTERLLMSQWLMVAVAVVCLAACGGGGDGPTSSGGVIPGGGDQPAIRLLPGDDSLGERLGTAPRFEPPVEVQGRIVQAVAGDQHVCALDEAGRAWCWGDPAREEGPFGAWPEDPTAIVGGPYQRLLAGARATCAVTADAALECWGPVFASRAGGTLTPWRSAEANVGAAWLTGSGTGLAIDRGDGAVLLIAETQAQSTVQFARAPDEVVSNTDITCARLGGEVWCVGANVEGSGGTGDRTQLNQPNRVAAVTDAVGLSLVDGATLCALERAGGVVCWPGFTALAPQVVATAAADGQLAGGCVVAGGRLRCGAPGLLGAGCAVDALEGTLTAGVRRACLDTADGWVCAGRAPGAQPFEVAGLRELRLEACAP